MLTYENIYNEVLRNSFENSPLALVFWVVENEKISVLDWNVVSEKIFGWTKEEILGKDFFDFIIPDSERISVQKVVQMLKENRYPDIHINKNCTKSKEERIFKWFNTPTKDPYNGRVFVISLGEDITDNEIAKQKVEESERRFHLLFDKMKSGFAYHEIILDDNGKPIDYRFLEVNPEFERLTGLKADDVIGKTVKEVLPETENFWIEKYGEIALTGASLEFEDYSSALNKYFSVRAYSPEKNKFATIFNDITDIKLAQEKLFEQKQFYENILEKIKEAIIVCDVNDLIEYVNSSFLEFSGADLINVQNKNILKDFSSFIPTTIIDKYNKVKIEKKAIKFENQSFVFPSGRFVYISGWFIPIIKNDKCEKVIITFEDETEKIMAELEIRRLNRVYSILSNVNQAIVREKNINRLFESICKIAVQDGGFILSYIGVKDENENLVTIKAINSKVQTNLEAGQKIEFDKLTKNSQRVLQEGKFLISNDIEIEKNSLYNIFEPEFSLYGSLATYPLKLHDKVIGFFEFYSDEIGSFDLEEQKLLSELSDDISLALEYYELEKERILAENRIKELNRNLQTILQNSPAGIITLSIKGEVVSWNKSAEFILGWTEEEALGANIFEIYPEFTDTINLLKDLILNRNRVYNYELTWKRKDNTTVTLSVSAAPVLNENNEVQAVIAIIFDITEQKLSEEALLESERRFEELLKNVKLIALMLDAKGHITFCNDYLLDITGWRREEILGKNWFEYFLLDKDRKILENQFVNFINNKELPAHFENEIVTKEGKRLLINWSNTFHTNDYGQIIGTLSIGEDITDKRKAEDKIKILNKELEQKVYEKTRELERTLIELKYENEEKKRTAEILKITSQDLAQSLEKEKELNELKSKFIDTIIHQYRTPLSIILSSSTLASNYLELQDYEKINNHITKIKSTAKDMLRLLEDIIIIGKEQNEKMIPQLETINLNELYYEVIESLPVSDNKSHNFELFTNEASINIRTDRKFLKKILTNIISNAINYSEAGTNIKTTVKDLENKIEISIQDQGVGISQEEQKHLFDAFYRGKNVGDSYGSGLGLPIVKKLLEILGGSIQVESEVGIGSNFIITLPK